MRSFIIDGTTGDRIGGLADEDKKRAGSKPCRGRLALVRDFIALVPEARPEISQPHRGW